MNGPVFVDTSVLLCSRDASAPEKQEQAMAWMRHLWAQRRGRTSYQVLNEFYLAVTRNLRPGMDRRSAREDVRDLMAWHPIVADASVIDAAWRIQDHYHLSWWDALIVSSARVSKCHYLLSDLLEEDQTIATIKVINPLHTRPEDLGV